MKRTRGPSLPPLVRGSAASLLVALFGATLIAVTWLGVAYHMGAERTEDLNRAQLENGALVRAFEEHVRRAVKTSDNALLFLKREYETSGTVTASMRSFVDRAKDDPIFNQMAVADAAGNLLLSAVPLKKPVNIAQREHFRAQTTPDAAGLYIGKPVVTQVSGTWSFFLSRRLSRADGTFAGVVTIGLDPQYFAGYYGAPEVGQDRAVLLVGRDGIVRARHFRRNTRVGQDIGGSPLFRELRTRASGTYEVVSPIDGLPRLASFRAMPDYPLVVVVSVLRASALAPFEQKRAWHLTIGGVFTLFVAAFCGFLVRSEAHTRRQSDRIRSELVQRLAAEEERLALERKMQEAQKLESLGVLAGGIAHDFNNLLMAVLGNLELAQAQTGRTGPPGPHLERAAKAAERAAELANQMLAYSGKGKFLVEPVDLSKLATEMEPLLETVLSKRAVLSRRLAPGLPPVEADVTQLRQVLMNLLTNASDALGPEGGTITVKTEALDLREPTERPWSPGEPLPPGRYVCLEVSDTGCGIEHGVQARIFDPFYSTKQTGRGLGLAAVLGIVRGHRGTIELQSAPGRGTTFRVLLPAAGRAESLGTREVGQTTRQALPERRERGTVLLADDDEAVRAAVGAMLSECGYEVVAACDGAEAVELCRERDGAFAAAILDLTMPRLGGDEAMEAMRRLAPELPILLMSGFSEQDAARRLGGARRVSFLQKPFRFDRLVAALEAAAG